MDDDGTCVPFLVSQHVHGDVSEITSPHFQVEKRTFLKPDAASLFARISKGISSALSPATPVFDSPSTINAEDFLFEERSVNKWNVHPASPLLSFGGVTPGLRSQNAGHISKSNNYNRSISSKPFSRADSTKQGPNCTESKILGEEIQRRVKDLRADSVPKGKSVSWVISPSTQSPVSSKISHPKAKKSDPGEDLNNSLQAFGTASGFWREIVDPESGRTYYYNRETRKTKWRLPEGALVQNAYCQSHHQKFDPNVTTDQIQLDKPLTPQQYHWQDAIGVTKLCISRSLDEGQSKSSQQIATYQRKERQPRVQQQPVSRQQNLPQEESKSKWQSIESSKKSQQSSSSQQTRRPENLCDTENCNEKVSDCDQSEDCTPDAVFCLYCGLKCESAAIFGSHHLPQCDKFAYMQQHGPQIELERILFRAWSKIGSSTDICSPEHASSHRPITASEDQRQILSRRCHTFEEDDSKVPGLNFKSVVERKTCPFCDEVFTYGNQFSSHLLKCEVRKRMRKQRRSTVVVRGHPPDCVTPGRRMPWELII
jgi:hypothetical protein